MLAVLIIGWVRLVTVVVQVGRLRLGHLLWVSISVVYDSGTLLLGVAVS